MRTFDPVVERYDGRKKMAETLAHSSGAQFAAIGLLNLSHQRIVDISVGRGSSLSSMTEPGAKRSVSEAFNVSLSLRQAGPALNGQGAEPRAGDGASLWINSNHHLIGIGNRTGDLAAFVALICNRARGADTPERRKMVALSLAYADQFLHERADPTGGLTAILPDQILRSLSFGFAVVETSGAIYYMKDNAEDWMDGFDELQIANDRLSARSALYQGQLHSALVAATAQTPSPSVLAFDSGDDEAPRTVIVLPMPDSQPLALVIFSRDHEDHSLRELVFENFGLTIAERRLALLLLSGKSLQAAAQEANLTISTARSYLKRIFAKTGINRQSQLMSLYYKMVPSVRSIQSPHGS